MGQFTVHQCASGGALPLSLALCLECLFLALAIENFYSNTKSSSGIPFSVMTFLISIPTPKSSPTVIYSLSFTLFACRNLTSYTYSTQFVAMLVTKNRQIKYYNILCILQLLVITDKWVYISKNHELAELLKRTNSPENFRDRCHRS